MSPVSNENLVSDEEYLVSRAKECLKLDPYAAKSWMITAKMLFPNNFGIQKEPVIQELVTDTPKELMQSPEMDASPHTLCSVTVKGEPDETDRDLKMEVIDIKGFIIEELVPDFPENLKYSPPMDLSDQSVCSVTVKSEQEDVDIDLLKTAPKTEVDGLKEFIIEELVPDFPEKLEYSPPMDLSDQSVFSVTVKSEQEDVDIDLLKTAPKTEVDDLKKEPVTQELVTDIPKELMQSREMDASPRPLCSVTNKGEPDKTDMDLPFKTSRKIYLKKEPVIQELVTDIPKELMQSPEMDASPRPLCAVTAKGEPDKTDMDLRFKTSRRIYLKKEPVIQELVTDIPKELMQSREMDASPRPLCSVTAKGKPFKTDMDQPFKTSRKIYLKEFILEELESRKKLKYSPPVYLPAQPLCSVTVKSEQEEVDTHLSKTSPKTEVDDLKSEMPDGDIDGNSSDRTSPNCASYSLPSASGAPVSNLCTSKDEVLAPYSCALCKTRFQNKCQFRSHLNSRHQIKSENVVDFSCSACDKVYVKRTEFMKHILEFHLRVKMHICPVCNETFHTCWDLHEHLSKYSDDDSYSCPRCDQRFPTRTTLELHMQSEGGYTCKICNKKCYNHSALNQHIKAHTEEPLTCDICDKSYIRRTAFAQHISTHSDYAKLDCPKCEKKFSTQSSLTNHLKVHGPQRPYTCETCNKTFCRRSHLIGHMATHSDVKAFTCSTCQRSFTRGYDLKRHEKIHREGHTWTVRRSPIKRS